MTESKPSKTGSKTTSSSDDLSAISYEMALEELESIIAKIEAGQIPLEESLRQYRRGAALVRRCRDVLDGARAEVERIAVSDLLSGSDGTKAP